MTSAKFMKIRAISIDDDPISSLMIRAISRGFPSVEFLGSFTDPVEGIEVINNEKPDLVFLDVEMPSISGLQILGGMKSHTKVVVMSSNPRFRKEALGLNACSFLRKPVSVESFSEALASVERKIRLDELA